MKRFATLVAGAVMAAGAMADTVSYSFSNPLQTTEINQSATLGLFNSSLGTLTGVSLVLNGAVVTSADLTNNAAQAQNARVNFVTDIFFSSSLGALSGLLGSVDIALSSTTGVQSYAVGETKNFGPLNASDSVTFDAALSALLGSFQAAGGGDFTVSCTSLSGVTFQGGGNNIGANIDNRAGCGAEVVYTYTSTPPVVPEPGSLALVGLALAGLAGVSRKAKKA